MRRPDGLEAKRVEQPVEFHLDCIAELEEHAAHHGEDVDYFNATPIARWLCGRIEEERVRDKF